MASEAGEVAAIFFEGFVGGFGIGGGDALASSDGLQGGEEFLWGDAEFFEDLGGSCVRIFLEGGEEKVFDADVVVFEFGCFGSGATEKGLEPRGDNGAAWGSAWARDFG